MRFIAITAFIFLSCSNNPNRESSEEITKEKTDSIIQKPVADVIDGCFWSIQKRDSLVASLSQHGNIITGKLSFDNFEKDGSSGPVNGRIEDDIIRLWYAFKSEGMESVMEVWFKKEGNTLLRGIGPMAVKADTTYFTDAAAIEFISGQALHKVDCKEVPSKYK
ncbi:MAG TPA: hypothetical protein VI461_09715 [Chitinophagaceae bacterium]|nr:hypothetical protein [Chitinophagaceae bacterium]